MKLIVDHLTSYRYDATVNHSIQYLRLTPRDTARQQVLAWQLTTPAKPQRLTDGYGNILDVLTVDAPHQSLQISACGEVEISGADDGEAEYIAPAVFLRETPLTHVGPALFQFLQSFRRDQPPTIATLTRLMHAIRDTVSYQPGAIHGTTAAEQAFSRGTGVGQDHSHIFVSCCRALGIPARYVSGYLHSDNQHSAASHAWTEAYVDGCWRTFDISNALTTPCAHLKLAVGLDYLDACPVRGSQRGGNVEIHAGYPVSDDTRQAATS